MSYYSDLMIKKMNQEKEDQEKEDLEDAYKQALWEDSIECWELEHGR